MKKVFSVFISLILTFGLSFSGFAAIPQRIKSLREDCLAQMQITLQGGALDATGLAEISAWAGDELTITLAGATGKATDDLFLDQNKKPIDTANVTVSKMRAANIQVTQNNSTDLIERIELDVQAAKPVIHVYFVSVLPGVEPQAFAFDLMLSIGGVVQEHSKMDFTGTLRNREQILGDAATADASGGDVLLAERDIKNIALDVGHDVTLTASMKAGGRYWAMVLPSEEQSDLDLMHENPAISEVLTLSTAGFHPSQLINVRITPQQTMFVYNEEGKFLGTTAQILPYQEKYYLHTKRSK